jgi:hypothetical protein
VRLSRDKVNVLARAVADALKTMDEVDFIEDPNTIRQETRKILEDLLAQEENRKPKAHHPRRLAGVGYSLPQVLQRGSEEAGHVVAPSGDSGRRLRLGNFHRSGRS